MSADQEFELGRSLLARLEHGGEIIGQITSIIREEDIRAEPPERHGALEEAEIGCYNQQTHKYQGIKINEPVEIASCSGNISLLEGRPFAHVHAVLSGMEGKVWADTPTRAGSSPQSYIFRSLAGGS